MKRGRKKSVKKSKSKSKKFKRWSWKESDIFVDACRRGNLGHVRALIKSGVDPNIRDICGTPIIWHAVCYGCFDIVKFLLENGADVNASNRREDTALDIACKSGSVACALQLVCFGAEMNTIKDSNTLICQISARLQLLRSGTSIRMLSFMSIEERHFMWSLAFSLIIQRREVAFKVYNTVLSFITFHGIFMAKDYFLGENSVWQTLPKKYCSNDYWDD